jgi:hypothetical protein
LVPTPTANNTGDSPLGVRPQPHIDPLREAHDVIAKVQATTRPKQMVPISTVPEPLELVPTVAAKVATVTTACGFSVASVHSLPTVTNPRQRLDILIEELCTHRDYHRIRDEYCQMSILINLEGVIAPAFRPQPKVSATKGNPIYFEIHRDQLVIDCHWLHCKGERITVRDTELRHLFDRAHEFPFGQAWAFAKQKWKSQHRVDEVLHLTIRQQCQLVTLHSKQVADRLERATKSTKPHGVRLPPKLAAVRQQLNEWGERSPRVVMHLKDYEHLWMASELLGVGAPPKHVAELFALAIGKSLDEKTVRDKLKNLNGHIVGVT